MGKRAFWRVTGREFTGIEAEINAETVGFLVYLSGAPTGTRTPTATICRVSAGFGSAFAMNKEGVPQIHHGLGLLLCGTGGI